MDMTPPLGSPRIIDDADYDRRRFIGGSNAAAIMGVGAYGNTALTCYLAKIGEGEEEMDARQRLFLERRKRWEGPIVEMLREEFGGNIVAINQRYQDPAHDFIAAEIDFEWADENGEIQNGEIKTCSPFAFGERQGWGEEGTADIPVHYAAQVMHGLGVMRRQTCIVAAMVGLDTMLFYRLERDEETIAAIREEEVRFWTEHVVPRVPPDPVSYDDCLRLALRMRGKPVEIDDATAERVEQLRLIRANQKALDGDESAIKFEILDYIRRAWLLEAGAAIEDNAVLLRNGLKIATYNLQSTRRIDVERLREEQQAIAAEYTKSTSTRVLRISKPT
jgi:predicted phage-related endonuclease